MPPVKGIVRLSFKGIGANSINIAPMAPRIIISAGTIVLKHNPAILDVIIPANVPDKDFSLIRPMGRDFPTIAENVSPTVKNSNAGIAIYFGNKKIVRVEPNKSHVAPVMLPLLSLVRIIN